MQYALLLTTLLWAGACAKRASDQQQLRSVAQEDSPEHVLLHLLDRTKALPPWSTFKSECIAHVKGIVATVDHSYTDMQLEHVLEQQCHLDHEFEGPEDGFDGYDHCKDFAKKLTKARHEEVETGCEHGYTTFCEDYYIHKGGVIPGATLKEDIEEIEVEAEEVVKEIETAGISWKVVVVGLAIVALIVLMAYAVKKRAQPMQ